MQEHHHPFDWLLLLLPLGNLILSGFDRNLIFQTNLVKGLPTILISVLIFSGLQLLVLGFIGEYVTSLHNKIKKDKFPSKKYLTNYTYV